MVRDYQKYLQISKVLNSTFGDSGVGTVNIVSGRSVKIDPVDEGLLKARVTMIVQFRTDHMMRELLKKNREEAIELIRAAMKKVSDDYKERFDENLRLKMDDNSLDEDVEFVHINNGLSRAFYRVKSLIKVQ